MNIYEFEEEFKLKMNNSADDAIRFALLETLPPIADYSWAIDILKDSYSKYKDFRMVVLITFLVSTWENYRENEFLTELNSFLEAADKEQKAIIFYLNAYDIFMHRGIVNKKDEYVELLNKSVNLDTKFVYNYYRLAQVSNKRQAKRLIKKALLNIERVYSDSECEDLQLSDFVSYESFLNEEILGTTLTHSNYLEIKHLKSSSNVKHCYDTKSLLCKK